MVKGFFDKTLNLEEMQKIKKISFAFIDCDIYESAIPIFEYLNQKLSLILHSSNHRFTIVPIFSPFNTLNKLFSIFISKTIIGKLFS